jgi:hypothetical protein
MNRLRYALSLAVSITAFFSAIGKVSADLIPIANASFEDPPTDTFVAIANGWSFGGSGGGVWNINNDSLQFWNVPAPDGNQIGYLSPADTGGLATMMQTLSTNLQADTFYTLSAWVGHPVGYPATFTMELLAGSQVLASYSGTGPQGSFQRYQVTFDSTGSSYVGQPLGIELVSDRPQTGFDAITLNASPTAVPEPSTAVVAALSAGLLGLVRYGRLWLAPKATVA